jgi:beta-phosphoglucomutase-like phosphatase (HAD superfamily)
MGVEPQGCVVIEDSVYGVRAGVAAGMTVYGYAGGLTPADELAADGAVVFDAMLDLVDVLVPDRRDAFPG